MNKNEKQSTRSTGRFTSVLEMVRATADREFADDFEQTLSKSRVVNTLAVLRAAKGLTQEELADKLGQTHEWISKIENSNDDELGFGDLTKFAAGLGLSISVAFIPNDVPRAGETTGVDVEVRGAAGAIEPITRKAVRKPRKHSPAI